MSKKYQINQMKHIILLLTELVDLEERNQYHEPHDQPLPTIWEVSRFLTYLKRVVSDLHEGSVSVNDEEKQTTNYTLF